MGEYQELRYLKPGGIDSLRFPQVEALLAEVGRETGEPSRGLDLLLLKASQATPDPLPLLCLRCRISHALEAWLKAAANAYRHQYGIELEAIASYGLDDDGKLTIRTGAETTSPFVYSELALLPGGLVSPFSAEILRSYDPSICGLPHWARVRIQANNELKAYFRQHGLLLISDWALLRDSSARRVRQACEQQLSSGDTIEALCELHGRYGPLYDAAKGDYKARTGKSSGWQPDLAFLRELAPEQEPFDTQERLKAIALAVRRLRTNSTRTQSHSEIDHTAEPVDLRTVGEGPDDAGSTPAELKALIMNALQRAMDQHMPAAIAPEGRHADLKRCLWAGWSEGLKQRPLADRCGTTQGTVSKQLRPKQQALVIATAAAAELRRHPAFASCGRSVEAAERLVDALRNHLLEPEQEGDIAPLRRWVQHHLNPS